MNAFVSLKSSILGLVLVLILNLSGNGLVSSLNEQQMRLFDERLNLVLIANLREIYQNPFQDQFCFGIWNELNNRIYGNNNKTQAKADPNKASTSQATINTESEPILPTRPDPTSVQLLADVRDWAYLRFEMSHSDQEEILMSHLVCIINDCLPIIGQMARRIAFAPHQSSSSSDLEDENSFHRSVETIIDAGSSHHLEQLAQSLHNKQAHIDNLVQQQKQLVTMRLSDVQDKMKSLSESQRTSTRSMSPSKQVIDATNVIDKNIADSKKCAELKERTLRHLRSFSSHSSGSLQSPKTSSADLSRTTSQGSTSDATDYYTADSDLSPSSEEVRDSLNRCKSELLENELAAKQAEFELETKIRATDRSLNHCNRELDHIKMLTRGSIMRFNSQVNDDHKIH